jgi:hypothetical protein
MNMDNNRNLLHNMSAPPKSAVRYAGLAGLATQGGPGGSGVTQLKYRGENLFGTPVRFSLGSEWLGLKPFEILDRLGVALGQAPGSDPSKELALLINQRAIELPLPEGCAVIPADPSHKALWNDPLAALAILSKSTDTVWLRSKTPSLLGALQRESVSLLVPPGFALQLPEAEK